MQVLPDLAVNNLSRNNYSYQFTPTKTTASGTFLYIANHVTYKRCNELNIYKNNELEPTFTEIVNPNPLSANITKWSNTPKQFVSKLPMNCLSVFYHFVGLVLKGLKDKIFL